MTKVELTDAAGVIAWKAESLRMALLGDDVLLGDREREALRSAATELSTAARQLRDDLKAEAGMMADQANEVMWKARIMFPMLMGIPIENDESQDLDAMCSLALDLSHLARNLWAQLERLPAPLPRRPRQQPPYLRVV